MKKAYPLSIALLAVHFLMAQSLPFNPSFKPFYHGVASGDPLEDRVIIWTRVTPEQDQTIEGKYWVATDTALTNIVKTGSFSTDLSRDYTVKIDVMGLLNNTTYYYAFTALGKRSAIGRTKTTPSVSSNNVSDVLKFAVVTCANYEGGYFNAYNKVAERNDLNAVIHLGDYFYEYGTGEYRNAGLTDTTRKNIPAKEVVSKTEYRTRYSLYRLDKDLQRLHHQHPFIAVWDDHESANNAYDNGAQNHQVEEGNWNTRKRIAKEVYYEWMPIRGTSENTLLYRTVSYGKLMDLFMLDTRLEGRQKQPLSFIAPDDSLNPRRIMSTTQYNWLVNNLKNSPARWKVIGNQVIFSNINVGFAGNDPTSLTDISLFENLFLDSWEGYLLQRNSIIDSIQKNNLKNIIFVSGDSHASWAFDVTKEPVLYPLAQFSYIPQSNQYNAATKKGYTPSTGEGSQCVEFCTPSISAANFDETLPGSLAAVLESIINKPQPSIPGNPNYNPHLKYVDLDRHGYFILDVRADSVQADFFYTPSVVAISNAESWGVGVSSTYNSNRITTSATLKMAPPKPIQDISAPLAQVVVTSIKEAAESVIFSLYPNPASQSFDIQYGLNQSSNVQMVLMDIKGQVVKTIAQYKNQPAGIYQVLNVDIANLNSGMYLLQIRTKDAVTIRKLMVE